MEHFYQNSSIYDILTLLALFRSLCFVLLSRNISKLRITSNYKSFSGGENGTDLGMTKYTKTKFQLFSSYFNYFSHIEHFFLI